jgi:hypothetical protein
VFANYTTKLHQGVNKTAVTKSLTPNVCVKITWTGGINRKRQRSWLTFRRWLVWNSDGTRAIITERFHNFPQSLSYELCMRLAWWWSCQALPASGTLFMLLSHRRVVFSTTVVSCRLLRITLTLLFLDKKLVKVRLLLARRLGHWLLESPTMTRWHWREGHSCCLEVAFQKPAQRGDLNTKRQWPSALTQMLSLWAGIWTQNLTNTRQEYYQ